MKLFRSEAINFQRRKLLGNIIVVQPVKSIVITALLALSVLLLILYLYFTSYSASESLRGSVMPASGLSQVTATAHGTLTALHLHSGDQFETGTMLATLVAEKPASMAPRANGFFALDSTASKVALERKIDLIEQRSNVRLAHLKEQLELVEQEIIQSRALATLNREIADAMLAAGKAPASDSISQELYSQRSELNSQLKINELLTSKQQLDLELELLPIDREQQILELQLLHGTNAVTEDTQTAASSEKPLYADRSGVIVDVLATPGETVKPGQTLFTVQDIDSPLVAEVIVPLALVPYVEPGKTVQISIDDLPQTYTSSGTVARVSTRLYAPGQQIGSLSVESTTAHRATVHFDSPIDTEVAAAQILKPGMLLHVDIKLEKRRLLNILFPLLDGI